MSKFLGALLVITGSLFWQGDLSAIQDTSTGQSFPDEVSFDYNGKAYNLEATGVSTRKKFFVKVYSVAHYLQKAEEGSRSDVMDQIFDDNRAKQLTLKWVRSGGSKKVQDGYHESFEKVLGGREYGALRNEINQYVSWFGDVNSGEEHVIRWIPGGIIDVYINGQHKGTITNEKFAKAVWEIWLGRKSVVNRNQLVARLSGK